MTFYLIKLQHHHITEEFGTVDCNDPYDHYIGSVDEKTNLRYMIVNRDRLNNLTEEYIQDDPFNYESIEIMYEFYYDHEIVRFVECMANTNLDELIRR